MKTPKVSVNIACFNSSRFIRETLDSVLSQTYGDFEVIVMDDGSSDGTGEIVKAYADPRIRYFYKDNEGLSETRNKSVGVSSGEYIALLDHDDLWLSEKLEREVRLLEENAETALVFSDCYISRGGKRDRRTYFDRYKPERGRVFEELLCGSSNFIPLSTVIMRKSVFDKIGYFKKEFKIGEEYDLFLRAAKHYEFDYVEAPLAVYRMHANNVSKNVELFIKETLDIIMPWGEGGLSEKNRNRFLQKEANLLAELGSFYALNFMKREALDKFDLSLKKYPENKAMIRKQILSFFGCHGYRILARVADPLNTHAD